MHWDRAFELPKALEWYVRAGAEQAEDVARNNAHDAFHHLWDVDRWTAGNLTSTTPSLG